MYPTAGRSALACRSKMLNGDLLSSQWMNEWESFLPTLCLAPDTQIATECQLGSVCVCVCVGVAIHYYSIPHPLLLLLLLLLLLEAAKGC